MATRRKATRQPALFGGRKRKKTLDLGGGRDDDDDDDILSGSSSEDDEHDETPSVEDEEEDEENLEVKKVRLAREYLDAIAPRAEDDSSTSGEFIGRRRRRRSDCAPTPARAPAARGSLEAQPRRDARKGRLGATGHDCREASRTRRLQLGSRGAAVCTRGAGAVAPRPRSVRHQCRVVLPHEPSGVGLQRSFRPLVGCGNGNQTLSFVSAVEQDKEEC